MSIVSEKHQFECRGRSLSVAFRENEVSNPKNKKEKTFTLEPS